MIQLSQVCIKRGGRSILRQLSFQIQPGQVTTVLGKNGAGKTTLLEALNGQLPIHSGELFWDGARLCNPDPVEMAGRRAVLSQHVQLSFPIRVFELVEMGAYARYQQLTARERRTLVDRILEQADLTAFRRRNFQQLSGGEKQRVLLAKCLTQLACSRHVYPHQYLFLDEPTNSLDIEQQYRLLAQVRALALEQRIGVLAILHDLNLAAQCSDEILLLKDGLIRYQGAPHRVLQEKHLKDVFDIHSIVGQHPLLDCPHITILPYAINSQSETTTDRTESSAA